MPGSLGERYFVGEETTTGGKVPIFDNLVHSVMKGLQDDTDKE